MGEQTRESSPVFVLGPSHFERRKLVAAKFPWAEVEGDVLSLEGRYHVMGVASLPVHNQVTLQLLRRAYAHYDQVVWCVGNWFFGNLNVDKIRQLEGLPPSDEGNFLWAHFYPGVVSKDLMTAENNALMVDHSIKCVDFVVAEMPRIKLLFWCLAKRTFNWQGKSQQIPANGLYGAMMESYEGNTLDVLRYHDES